MYRNKKTLFADTLGHGKIRGCTVAYTLMEPERLVLFEQQSSHAACFKRMCASGGASFVSSVNQVV